MTKAKSELEYFVYDRLETTLFEDLKESGWWDDVNIWEFGFEDFETFIDEVRNLIDKTELIINP